MKAFKLSAVAALAVSGAYAQEAEGTENQPEIAEPLIEPAELEEEGGWIMPDEFFGQTDLLMGFVVGMYGPIQARVRDNDCRARFFNLASNISTYSALFDKPFDATPAAIGLTAFKVAMTAFSGLGTWTTCMGQWTDLNDGSPRWTDDFGLFAKIETTEDLDGYWTHPQVMQDAGALADVIHSVQLLLSVSNTMKNFKSGFYFYFAGRALGQFAGLTFTGLDKWANLGMITPQKPWERYAPPQQPVAP